MQYQNTSSAAIAERPRDRGYVLLYEKLDVMPFHPVSKYFLSIRSFCHNAMHVLDRRIEFDD